MRPCPGPDCVPHLPTCFTVPIGSVDTHAHVIGRPPAYPFVASRSYTPPSASTEAYMAMLDATGMTYGVLVQVSVHGTDNRVMLEALAANRTRLRGIAVVPPDLPEATWRSLNEAGVVGLRINTLFGGGVGFKDLERYEAICAELSWHLQFLTDVYTLAPIATRISRLRVPFVIDHMGYLQASDGLDSSGTRLILGLLNDGAWVKLSGAYRLSDAPPYADTIPIARALIKAAPDRCIWGSDWPHVAHWNAMPNVGDLLDLLADWAPEPEVRENILVANSIRLYGFPLRDQK
ncbi:amidohydrolase family protein [Acidiphilium sp. AL]|uniref:Amidohydrolase family protein n=1 Tax=Acidiphilium iwatense TaxID=768198 RepID=A0ABS9E1Q4_9PROT|nr:amidohydrolase family protein [Acidiphilium sp. AL]MCF3948868.1 amidohydrolase family protein [Acidiphilium iwatense]MCU4162234.1 amidohydrolase family protein [Acidiphilium sp. AL]